MERVGSEGDDSWVNALFAEEPPQKRRRKEEGDAAAQRSCWKANIPRISKENREPLEKSDLMAKMVFNLYKAHIDHGEAFGPAIRRVGISERELAGPVSYSIGAFGVQGFRTHMEDTHFYEEIDGHMLAGVFDGHGLKKEGSVAKFCGERFPRLFREHLTVYPGNIHSVFESTFSEINREIFAREEDKTEGATAIVSCFAEGFLYAATVGDAEGYVVDFKEEKSIPLSPIRNWYHIKEQERGMEIDARFKGRVQLHNTLFFAVKTLREPSRLGLNVSRALGDQAAPSVIGKPKISMIPYRKKDLALLGCDGIFDGLKEIESLFGETEETDMELVKGLRGLTGLNVGEKLFHLVKLIKEKRIDLTIKRVESVEAFYAECEVPIPLGDREKIEGVKNRLLRGEEIPFPEKVSIFLSVLTSLSSGDNATSLVIELE